MKSTIKKGLVLTLADVEELEKQEHLTSLQIRDIKKEVNNKQEIVGRLETLLRRKMNE